MKKRRRKILFLFLLFLCVYLGYKKLAMHPTLHNDQKIVELVLNDSFQEKSILEKISTIPIPWKKTIRLLQSDSKKTISVSNSLEEPLIYLYNSHPTEEYSASNIGEYMVQPTVIMNNYLLQDLWSKHNITSYVEEESVKDILNENNWNYASSYRASRILMEDAKKKYPSLEYFIDIHRDSLEKDRTTVQIGDESYAKVLFIIGLENSNYQENLSFTEKIVEKMNTYYPSLCKGYIKKKGQESMGYIIKIFLLTRS